MLLLLGLMACETTIDVDALTCHVELTALEPASAAPGDTVVVTGTPFTIEWDTALLVGAEQAQVVSVDRTGCDSCDGCRVAYSCAECGMDCDACDLLCEESCVETVSFVVPELDPGSYRVRVYNAHAVSEAELDLLVLGSDDTGDTSDTSGDSGDTSSQDSGDSAE